MVKVLGYIWKLELACLLLICGAIVVAGTYFVLKTACKFWFEEDIVGNIENWIKDKLYKLYDIIDEWLRKREARKKRIKELS